MHSGKCPISLHATRLSLHGRMASECGGQGTPSTCTANVSRDHGISATQYTQHSLVRTSGSTYPKVPGVRCRGVLLLKKPTSAGDSLWSRLLVLGLLSNSHLPASAGTTSGVPDGTSPSTDSSSVSSNILINASPVMKEQLLSALHLNHLHHLVHQQNQSMKWSSNSSFNID